MNHYGAGIWSPDASIRCVRCNNALVGKAHWARKLQPTTLREDAGRIAYCDDCGQSILLEEKPLADLQALARAIPGAYVDQTGGMCMATSVRVGKVRVLITDDEDRDEAERCFVVGCYDEDEDGSVGDTHDQECGVAFDDVPTVVARMIAEYAS